MLFEWIQKKIFLPKEHHADVKITEQKILIEPQDIADRKSSAKRLFHQSNIALQSNDFVAAETLLNSAIELDPEFDDAYCNLGAVLRDMGRVSDSEVQLRTALRINPANAVAAFNLAMILLDIRHWMDAIPLLHVALQGSPDKSDIYYWLGNAQMGAGDHLAAQSAYEAAFRLNPSLVRARWGYVNAQIPPIFQNETEYELAKTNYRKELNRIIKWLEKNKRKITGQLVGSQQPFYLAYIPGNHREILSLYGNFCASQMTATAGKISGIKKKDARKIKLVIISSHVTEHSVWNAFLRGWVEYLDRSRFELHLVHVGRDSDAETNWAKKRADYFHGGTHRWEDWLKIVQEIAPDVLIYPELGMDAITLQLAALRIAPLQMVGWGHPITSGLPTMDVYISCAAFEQQHSQGEYTETLAILPGIGACYRPYKVKPVPCILDGDPFLSKHKKYFLCAGTAMKYGPEDDGVWCDIAGQCPGSQLVFFKKSNDCLAAKFENRLKGVFEKRGLNFEQSVLFIPWQLRPQFFSLLTGAVAYLDSIGFSGFNTTMQAIECATPIIAYEGAHMRGRFASGILRTVGEEQWVATSRAEFVRLACKIYDDEKARVQYARNLMEKRTRIFNDVSSIKELERIIVNYRELPS